MADFTAAMTDFDNGPFGDLLPMVLADRVALSEVYPVRQFGLRLRPPVPAYLAGLPLPLQPNRITGMGPVRLLWLGPDEWLIVTEGDGPDVLPRLERAAAGGRAVVTDLSSSRVIVGIAGPQARALLETGCGLDLHPRVFGPGQCAQTLFARVPVILDQISQAPAYRLFVRRSQACWLARWLIDAAEGLDAAQG